MSDPLPRPTTSSSTPKAGSPDSATPTELRVGVDLAADLRQLLIMSGVEADRAGVMAARFSESMADVESYRDARGTVWSKVPTHAADGTALSFVDRNVAILREAATAVLTFSPEAVAVFAGVAYPSAFREAKIERAVWLGRGGAVLAAPDVFNSLDTALMLTEAMYVRLQQIRMFEQKMIGDLLTQKKEAYEQSGRPPEEDAPGQAGADESP